MNALQTAQLAYDYAVPDSYYVDDIARERAGEAMSEEYIVSGHLPNGQDAGTVDEMLPDCLHELTVASQKMLCRGEAVEAVANKIAAMRQEIIDELIDEALSA